MALPQSSRPTPAPGDLVTGRCGPASIRRAPPPKPSDLGCPADPPLSLGTTQPSSPRMADWPLLPQVELNIVAGYGSPKDVAVYAALGLPPSQTYIVGRAVRKLQAQCQVRAE